MDNPIIGIVHSISLSSLQNSVIPSRLETWLHRAAGAGKRYLVGFCAKPIYRRLKPSCAYKLRAKPHVKAQCMEEEAHTFH